MATFTVNKWTDNGLGDTAGTLSYAIVQANTLPGNDEIVLTRNIRLTGPMTIAAFIDSNIALKTEGGNIFKINGDVNNNKVSDSGDTRPLFIKSGVVSISNLNIINGCAQGTNGGGGGAGMGGGLFIYDGSVTLNNVVFSNNRAIGGDGGDGGRGGGMGIPGIPANNGADGNRGTDGNLGEDGGNGESGGDGGEGGDGGRGGDGGDGSDPWLDDNDNFIEGLGGDGGRGGNGGWGGDGGEGGHGGQHGGDWPKGGVGDFGDGGNGGFGGGGGFGIWDSQGGDGGFGGGGGSAVYEGAGGNGGYGGGGGTGSITGSVGSGGDGGFGGGGGGGNYYGGGGAGMGGGLFIRSGSLRLNNVTFTNNHAEGGTGFENGKGLGGGLFIMQSLTNSNGNNQEMPASVPFVSYDGLFSSYEGSVVFSDNSATDDTSTSVDNDNIWGTIYSDLPNVVLGTEGNDILNGTNEYDNIISFEGNDRLDGKGGPDMLLGGEGNDTYTVNNDGVSVEESSNEGTDTVKASVTYILPDNVEKLTLTGSAAINGTGNVLNNTLIGNSAANILNGGAGSDTLTGKGGADIFLFRFGESEASTAGRDRITDFAIGVDKIDLLTEGGSATGAPVAFTRAANTTAKSIKAIVAEVFADANGALAGAQPLGVNSAALVKSVTETYLIINDANPGLQLASDLLINIRGYTGSLPNFGAIPVSNFFV